MAAVIIKGSFASAGYGNIALKALQQPCKSANFAAGRVEVFIPPQFFRRFFSLS